MKQHRSTTTRLGWALALIGVTFYTADPAQAQIDSFRSVDGSHRGVGYSNLELNQGVQWSPSRGYSGAYMGSAYGNYYHGGGWYGPSGSTPNGGYRTAPATTPAASGAPYQTARTYEPGDGYRYPLYFNPATGSYFYQPKGR